MPQSTKMKVWVLIAAYNEEKTIGVLLDRIKDKGLSVIVIDDGSSDKTYNTARSKADIVLRNHRNFGKGSSIRKGIITLINDVDFDYVITMDADNQHSVSDIDGFLKEAEKGTDFVIGNRMSNPYGMPFIRILTNKLMSFIISKITGQNIPDTQCGFRLINKKILENINIATEKFEIESELLIKAARKKYVIKSIPIESLYFKGHTSKIRPFYDTLRFIKFLANLDNE